MNGLIQVGNLLKLLKDVENVNNEIDGVLDEVVFKARVPSIKVELPEEVNVDGRWISVEGVKSIDVDNMGYLNLNNKNGYTIARFNLWKMTVYDVLRLIELEEKAGIVSRLIEAYSKYLEERRKILEYVKSVKNALKGA